MAHNYIQLDYNNFTNVKLIIGNGFDLACGLESSYKSFFQNSESLYNDIDSWIKNKTPWNNNLTTWDLIFYTLKNSNTKFSNPSTVDWKDVESVMRLALGFYTDGYDSLNFNLSNVEKNIISSNPINDIEKTLAKQITEKYEITSSISFYKSLLTELEAFEERFSNYIKSQMTSQYQEKARKLLNESGLLKFSFGQLNSIDTFNYTTPDCFSSIASASKNFSVRHINGKLGSAIFGIDSHDIELSDPRYIFTKTYRKMNLLINGGRESHNRKFDNIVIYGHSLSEADYSYFFSIMDHLELDNYGKWNSRFVVAFSEYAPNTKENLSWNVLKLLNSYDKWKHPNSNRHGLTEILETSDRIGFTKIDTSKL